MSCAPVVGWGGAVREGRVLQAEGSSHVLLPELTAGAGARTKGAPRCAGRVAGVPTRPATPNRRHAFRRFPRCHWSVPWFGWGLKERHLVSRAATRLDWAGDALALRTQLRSSVTADSASAGHPHPTGTPSPSSFLSSGSFFLELYASGGCNKMEPYCWTGRGTPAGSHDDDGCGMGNGSGLSGESLRTSMYSASPPLHGAVGPCPRRLLPPTFELPVGPPPAPTIDAEMHDADDWPGLRWSTCHPEGERLADMLSSPTAWAAGMDKAANQMMSTLQSLPPLISPPPGLWTASAPGAIVPPPPPPRRRPALLAAMEEAAELLMQRFELRASGDTGGLPPPLGSVDVPRFVVTEDGSSSDRRAPTSPTAVWGFFEDDSDVCSSERTRGVGGVKLNSGLAVSRRVLTPSPSTSGALVMNVDVNAKSMGVTKLPARPKTVRSKNTTAGAASRNVPSPVTMALPVRATLSSTVPGAAAPPPLASARKPPLCPPFQAAFVISAPARLLLSDTLYVGRSLHRQPVARWFATGAFGQRAPSGWAATPLTRPSRRATRGAALTASATARLARSAAITLGPMSGCGLHALRRWGSWRLGPAVRVRQWGGCPLESTVGRAPRSLPRSSATRRHPKPSAAAHGRTKKLLSMC